MMPTAATVRIVCRFEHFAAVLTAATTGNACCPGRAPTTGASVRRPPATLPRLQVSRLASSSPMSSSSRPAAAAVALSRRLIFGELLPPAGPPPSPGAGLMSSLSVPAREESCGQLKTVGFLWASQDWR
ncbi:MAG: hypothetical protein ACPIOQ_19060, partial [Promethearchaeia archaeon]